MKGKYVTVQILLACLSRPAVKKNIHTQLEETIAARKIIVQEWSKSFFGATEKDIHTQLAETIAKRKELIRRWEELFHPPKEYNLKISEKKAA